VDCPRFPAEVLKRSSQFLGPTVQFGLFRMERARLFFWHDESRGCRPRERCLRRNVSAARSPKLQDGHLSINSTPPAMGRDGASVGRTDFAGVSRRILFGWCGGVTGLAFWGLRPGWAPHGGGGAGRWLPAKGRARPGASVFGRWPRNWPATTSAQRPQRLGRGAARSLAPMPTG